MNSKADFPVDVHCGKGVRCKGDTTTFCEIVYLKLELLQAFHDLILLQLKLFET